jgi:hypothetical protein
MTKAELERANLGLAMEAEHLRAGLVKIIQLSPEDEHKARSIARRTLRTNRQQPPSHYSSEPKP